MSRNVRRQRGQVIPIVALMTAVLVGSVALAADLSVQTHYRRSLQNATDAAALAGARDLTSYPTPQQSERQQAAADALATLHSQLGWSGLGGSPVTGWASGVVTASSGCGAASSSCSVAYTPPSPYASYTVTINSPPQSGPNAGAVNGQQYLEVIVNQSSSSGFAGAIGFSSGTEGARAVGYHFPAGHHFGFALYSSTSISSGNQTEIVNGSVYAGQYIHPQSTGLAEFCSQGGSIVLGAPQPPVAPAPSTIVSPGLASCYAGGGSSGPGIGGGLIGETNDSSCASANIDGISFTPTNSYTDPTEHVCVASPALKVPQLPAPFTVSTTAQSCSPSPGGNGHYSPGQYPCGLTVNAPLDPGVYTIGSGGIVTINGSGTSASSCSGGDPPGYTVCLDGVTFEMQNNSTINVISGVTAEITPFAPSPLRTADGVYPIFSSYLTTGVTVNVTNNGTALGTRGTIYLPFGTVNATSNSALYVTGQALVGTWNIQSGNHPNPSITYDPTAVASIPEVLRIAE